MYFPGILVGTDMLHFQLIFQGSVLVILTIIFVTNKSMKSVRSFNRLISVHLIERLEDDLEDLSHFLWHWTYPTITPTNRSLIEKRLYSKTIQTDTFDLYKLSRSTWVYVQPTTSRRHLFLLLTSDFCPHTYRKLLTNFASLFTSGKVSFSRFLHYYLTLLISESSPVSVSELGGRQLTLQVDLADTPLARQSHIKSIIRLFHLDVILIYTALLLKRKIAIYHHSQSTLLDFSTALSSFVSHRPHTDTHEILYPNVDLHDPEQLEHLHRLHHFIATFQDADIGEQVDLYDIYINLAAVEITISNKAREMFSMTKTHKEVAIALVRVAENESASSEDVIAEICKKTKELKTTLTQFCKDSSTESPDGDMCMISKATLQQKLLSPNLESFYWNFAIAEGMAKIELQKFK